MGCSQTGKKTSCSVLEYIYSIDKELAEEIERNVYKKSNIEGFIFQASYYSWLNDPSDIYINDIITFKPCSDSIWFIDRYYDNFPVPPCIKNEIYRTVSAVGMLNVVLSYWQPYWVVGLFNKNSNNYVQTKRFLKKICFEQVSEVSPDGNVVFSLNEEEYLDNYYYSGFLSKYC